MKEKATALDNIFDGTEVDEIGVVRLKAWKDTPLWKRARRLLPTAEAVIVLALEVFPEVVEITTMIDLNSGSPFDLPARWVERDIKPLTLDTRTGTDHKSQGEGVHERAPVGSAQARIGESFATRSDISGSSFAVKCRSTGGDSSIRIPQIRSRLLLTRSSTSAM